MATKTSTSLGLRSERGPILLALMVSTGVIAIDATILATAVPSVVQELGGFAQFPWLFSVYLLATAVSVPVYAKLADTFGRKPIMLVGLGLFLLGSILCGVAWSMPALIAFRAVQGLGAGAITPMSMTIAGDIYTVAERAKVQGYIASVWAMSSVVGPTLGGVFAQLDLWRGIFFVNIPLCLLAAWFILRNFHERLQPTRHRVDYLGATLLTVGATLVLLGVLEGGQSWAWASVPGIGVFVGGVLLLLGFVLVERRAAEPVLPLPMLGRRIILVPSLLSFGVGLVLIGLTTFVPTYLQNSLGTSPLVAGLALAALTLGWPLAATLSGRLLYLPYGFRPTVLVGVVLVTAGTLTLALLSANPSVVVVAVSCFITGMGLGLVASPSLIASQSSVEWHERGVATGLNMFTRSIGSAAGAAVFGAVANAVIASSGRPETDPSTATSAGGAVFWVVAGAAVLTVLVGLAMPQVRAPSASPRTGPGNDPAAEAA